mgnify:CR=1 FL=1
MEFNFAFAIDIIVVHFLSVEVQFNFKIIKEDLLLFSYGHTGSSFDLLDFVQAHINAVVRDVDLGEFVSEVLFGECSKVFLLVKPRVVVPDRTEASCFIGLLHRLLLI